MQFGDPSLPQRFWDNVQVTDVDGKTHWLWTGYVHKKGYGRITINKKSIDVHTLTTPECPPGLERDHKCEIKHCCNPDCIEFVSHLVNVQRGKAAEVARATFTKQRCKRNHVYDRVNSRGHKVCSLCIAIQKETSSSSLRKVPIV